MRLAALVLLAACGADDPWTGTFAGTLFANGTGVPAVVSIQRCYSFHLAIRWPGNVVLETLIGNDTTHAFADPLSNPGWTGSLDLHGEHLTGAIAIIAGQTVAQTLDASLDRPAVDERICPVPTD